MLNNKNIIKHHQSVTKDDRARLKNQKPCLLWLTGLSGSGKSTIANALELKLLEREKHSYILDGDNVRLGLNSDLGFSDEDRVENIRRVAEISKLFVDSGLIVVTAFISPFKLDRDRVRDMFEDGEFIEIFIDAPLEICKKRDPKGLYQKALSGEIENFTGITSIYEPPSKAEIHIQTDKISVEDAVLFVIDYLESMGYLSY
jgi:adenylylsulfate kinase